MRPEALLCSCCMAVKSGDPTSDDAHSNQLSLLMESLAFPLGHALTMMKDVRLGWEPNKLPRARLASSLVSNLSRAFQTWRCHRLHPVNLQGTVVWCRLFKQINLRK